MVLSILSTLYFSPFGCICVGVIFSVGITTDLIGIYKDKPAIIDFKQTNKPKRIEWIEDYFLQLAAYAQAWNETHDEKVTHTGILWVKANTRGEGKGGKIQGKGWELKVVNDIEKNFKMFKNIYEIYTLENKYFTQLSHV